MTRRTVGHLVATAKRIATVLGLAVAATVLARVLFLLVARKPGVPEPGSEEHKLFWVSFWAALYSGIIYSFFTGIVVGLVVYATQRAYEARQARRQALRELAILQEKVRHALASQEALNITNPVTAEPPGASAVVNVLEKFPLAVLEQAIGAGNQLMSRLREVQTAHSQFMAAARTLNERLMHMVREYNWAKGIYQVNDGKFVSFITARWLGASESGTLAWLEAGAELRDMLRETYEALGQEPRLQEPLGEYLTARNRLQQALDALRSFLNAQ